MALSEKGINYLRLLCLALDWEQGLEGGVILRDGVIVGTGPGHRRHHHWWADIRLSRMLSSHFVFTPTGRDHYLKLRGLDADTSPSPGSGSGEPLDPISYKIIGFQHQ